MKTTDATRRSFLAATGAGLLPAILPGSLPCRAALGAAEPPPAARPLLKLGLVTYNLGKDWSVETIIKNCTEAKFEAVELRTTHAHGVEVSLGAERRKEVRKRFEASPVALASLGSAFEFHSADTSEVKRNIDGAKEYAKLAADVGAKGIKVRPNGFPKAIPEDATLKQIGQSMAEVAESAARLGVEVRMEVHGQGTCRIPNVRKILDHAAHANVFITWNSNQEDLLDGGLEANFGLVKEKIHFVHMRDLYLEEYPFRKLLALMRDAGFSGYCCAEAPESADGVRVMKYYRGLFLAFQDAL